MLQLIKKTNIQMEKLDEWVWKGDKTGEYIVKFTYMMIQSNLVGEDEEIYKIL